MRLEGWQASQGVWTFSQAVGKLLAYFKQDYDVIRFALF